MIRGGLLTTLLFASSVTILATACSSSSSSGAGGACANYVAALRDASKECGRFNVSPTRESTYLARFQQTCQNALNAPGSAITPSLLDQCAAKIREQCGDDDACEDLVEDVRGTLPDGSTCDVDYQCASGQCKTDNSSQGIATCGKCAPAAKIGEPCPDGGCEPGASCRVTSTGTSTSSVCVAVRIANQGERCGGASDTETVRCASGLYCRYASTAGGSNPGTCEQPLGEGEACGQEAGYAACKPSLTCVNGKCGRLQPVGGDCTEPNDCASGLGCDATHKCAAIAWLANGEACDDNLRRCDVGYCARSFSSSTGPSEGGVCRAFIADGQPCDVTKQFDEERCDTQARCINGTCQLQDPAQCK